MAVCHSPESAWGKELWKWDHTVGETNPHDDNIKGMRPSSPQEYPMMLYKAGRNAKNQIALLSNRIAQNAYERESLERDGFVFGPAAAIERCEAQELEIAKLAANRAYQDRKLSPEAQAEAAAYEETVREHVAEVPSQPVKRRGRPKKIDDAQ